VDKLPPDLLKRLLEYEMGKEPKEKKKKEKDEEDD